MRQQSWESVWLDWARPIVRMQTCQPDHFEWCRSVLGPAEYPDIPEDPAGDPGLRWPGYVGERWQPDKGVLFVGSVHSDFRKNGRQQGDADRVRVVAGMVEANRKWRNCSADTAEGNSEYLAATRHAYSSLIPGWSRDGAFGEVRRALGDDVDEIAWTNLVHCRAQPRKTPAVEYKLQRECSGIKGEFPIGRLIAAIRPAAILVAVSPIEGVHASRFDFSVDGRDQPLLWAFDGGNGKRYGLRSEVWTSQFAALIAERRGRHGEGDPLRDRSISRVSR